MSDSIKPTTAVAPVTAAPATTPQPLNTPTAPVTAGILSQEQLLQIQQIAIGAAMAVQGAQAQQAKPHVQNVKQYSPQCGECQQPTSACKGKHVQMSVFPNRYPEYYEHFQGVKINGVQYICHSEGQTIAVPACAESTINLAVKQFEQEQRNINTSRSKMHNSGSIGKSGKGAVNAQSAWR